MVTVSRSSTLLLLLALAAHAAPVHYRTTAGLSLTVSADGFFSISSTQPPWTFAGSIGAPLTQIDSTTGTDGAGIFHRISFSYTLNGIPTASSIRVYTDRPVAIFSTTILAPEANIPLFPRITTYPQGLYRFSFEYTYLYQYGGPAGPQSPWAYFDSSGNTFILSPASHFPLAWNTQDATKSLVAGIRPEIPQLPAGFTQDTMLAVGQGINHTWDLWGRALTDLQGKSRPNPENDITLSTLSYWTDSVSQYYYNFIPDMGYEGTLVAVRQNFAKKNIPVGSMQLDSWWYPKGSPPAWNNNGDGINYGQYLLQPDPSILPGGLNQLQSLLNGTPLLVHARWIDPSSPVRQQYLMSGNVSIDPQYWSDTAAYLAANGVVTYEQDWLAGYAQPNVNLTDPEAHLDLMASSMAAQGITMQYCGQNVGQIMQGSKYSNLTTARVSPDGFNAGHWDSFLYNSRLLSALGIFPFADNVYSTDVMSLVLETNSAGMVGSGDAMGSEDAANLAQAVRPDGIIVKPDSPMVPLDSTYIADAQAGAAQPPMVAFSRSPHGAYVFAYSRSGAAAPIQFTPADLGLGSAVYIYNYFLKTGELVGANQGFMDSVPTTGAYYIVAPVSSSGIALFGDAGKFVALGRQRFQSLNDRGGLNMTLAFASGEASVTIYGYSPQKPVATAESGSILSTTYDPVSGIFNVTIAPLAAQNTASITLAN